MIQPKTLAWSILASSSLFLSTGSSTDLVTRADSLFNIRAEGSRGQKAVMPPIQAAVTSYERALESFPDSLSIHWKRLRAMHFMIQYVDHEDQYRFEIIEKSKRNAEASLSLASNICDKNILEFGTTQQLAERCNPYTIARLYFWSAICWGLWSKIQEGITTRLSGTKITVKYAQRALQLDPTIEDGGSQRLLAVIYAAVPRIPFVTGFVRKESILPLLEAALSLGPKHPGNRLLYASRLLESQRDKKDIAIMHLQAIKNQQPTGHWRVEWNVIRASAISLLKQGSHE